MGDPECQTIIPLLENDLTKLFFTGHMVNKLLKCYLRVIDFDDRDSYLNNTLSDKVVHVNNSFIYFIFFYKNLRY